MKYAVIVLFVVALGVTACGKRPRSVDPPEGTHEIYPKHYPPPDTPGSHL